ncbi:MAG: hypothetical protein HYR98_08275, partial [Nitrospirae bacterium]|nr:hypothetical protein [Nitrospirota bacterium]
MDVTDPENPKLYTRVNVLGHPRAVRTFRVPADAPLKNRNGDVVGIGDFALVTSGYWANEEYAWLSLVNLSDPKAPYSLGDMRIAKNTADYPYPDDGLLGRVYEAPGYPLDVAAVGGAGAYVAVLGMGIQGYKMEMLPRVYENGVPVPGYQQLSDGMAMEPSYRGLGTVGQYLLAVRNHTLEVLSAGLVSLSKDEKLTLPYFVRGVKDFPIDLDKDGSITPDEVIDLAITPQRGGIVIHQVTPEGVLNRLDFIYLEKMNSDNGTGDLCVDRRR